MATDPQPGAVPFQEAIDFLRAKLRLTSRGWTDVWQEQNAVAFTVAGAQSAQLVADFHQVISRAIRDGMTLAEFREDFDAIVERFGWSYRGSRGWRSRVIFETNLRTAYQAGRWQQAWDAREDRPFLRYVAVKDDRTRPQHRDWHGTVLPVTAAWWRTHYPPNGWGCRCTAQSLTARDLERRGYTVTDPAPKVAEVDRSVDTPDGPRAVRVPAGIDPGWAYNVGQAAQSARLAQQAARDIGKMPADLGAVVGESIAAATRRALAEDYRAWAGELIRRTAGPDGQPDLSKLRPDGTWRALGTFSAEVVQRMSAAGLPLSSAAIAISSQGFAHILRQSKQLAVTPGQGLPIALSVADVMALPEVVARPLAVLRQISNGRLLLVFAPTASERAAGRDAKIIVHVDRVEKLDGQPLTFNAVTSGGLVSRTALTDRRSYELLDGNLED